MSTPVSPLAVIYGIYQELVVCFVQAISLCVYSFADALCQYDYAGGLREMRELATKVAEPVVLECVFAANKWIVRASFYCQQLYNHYAGVRLVADSVGSVCACINRVGVVIYNYVMYVYYEPEGEWMSFHYLTAKYSSPYAEKYLYFDVKSEYEEDVDTQIGNMEGLLSNALMNIFMGKYYTDYLENAYPSFYQPVGAQIDEDVANEVAQREYELIREKTNDAALVVVRTQQTYTVRVFSPRKHFVFQLSPTLAPSRVKFLLVRYIHPKLAAPIPIHISREYFYEGNELLSHSFVLRYLEYLPRHMKYVFDVNYLVELMDGDFNLVRLQYGQYVCLRQTDYSVEEL